MQFNTLEYAVFLPLVVALYYILPVKLRLWVLLAASYIFYASWDPVFLVLIMGLTVLNYGVGIGIQRLRAAHRTGSARAVLTLGIILNLGTLGFFKYTLFLLDSLGSVLGLVDNQARLPHPSIILPLGISFFVFEFIHYLVDVWHKEPVIGSFLKFAVFAAFFPTQIAGPIKRYEAFVPQLEERQPLNLNRVWIGLRLIIFGLFKKVLLADNLAPSVVIGFNHVRGGDLALSPADSWLIVLAFTMQIYFDFSGYTDMGRGSAVLLGFQVPENFRRPYLSTNISEFWRRWHISLSTWLRDYVYISAGGNRRHRYRNLMLTMVLGGLWHGANWTFIIWGFFHGLWLCLYWFLRSFKVSNNLWGRIGKWPGILLGWSLTFGLICVGWVFFRAANFEQAVNMLAAMFGMSSGNYEVLATLDRYFILLVVIGTLWLELMLENQEKLYGWLDSRYSLLIRPLSVASRVLRPTGLVLLIALIALFRPIQNVQFIYFQF